MNDNIATTPEDLKLRLAQLLDRLKEPNWKTFVAKTPKNVYQFAKGEFETLRLEILKTNGSPTLKLIEKLGKKKVQICHFIDILESLEKDENINKALDLFMGEPPSIIIQPPAEIQLTVGDNVVVHCEAVGKQPLLYQWFKERQQLKDETSKELSLTKVNPLNEGLYICRVANVRGYQFSRWIRVVVEKQQDETVKGNKENKTTVPPEENREPGVGDDDDYCASDPHCQPFVTVHPQSVTLSYGSLLSLSCDCDGDPNPRYQWLKDEEEIPGATSRDLVISQVSQDHQGMYICRVSNNAVSVNSRCANVRITEGKVRATSAMKITEKSQEVCDKVALLIGNKDYDHCDKLGKLYHPTNDVADIAGVLRSIGFKVISLVNLRLHEMRRALQLFAKLLDPGVYAVFYFAGHGFETNGKSYLMPIDADEKYDCSQNLPANEVLQILQEREAKLKVLLLDCCRTTPVNQEVKDPISSGGLNAEQENVVIAFGCCSQGRVFEHRLKKNGYFAMHLLEHLGREKNVEQILLDVAKGVREEQIYDSFTGHIQMVYRHSSLAENWCLCDEVISNEERSLQALHWQRGHELPKSPVIIYRNDEVIVTLRFDAEFSNMMFIRARIDTEDDDVILQPLHFQIPPNKTINGIRVDEISKGDRDMPEKYTEDESILKLSNLQRLEGQLCLNLNVSYITSDDVLIKETIKYEFDERPLYARLV
ncbi:mucosa-associated lymphoid tissue lymphoma translocation protein 1 homolog isoform X3 [Dendronephthya gigantea]|uniref:mucosa-associated lymphoid tissue lymphoma translocation protein 1 homolog isoform X3 n=1 Tax=Dendronephthya gigantea TaxID=151771 RepID=UPI00106C4DA2|nr:mucosa-associated lymphoid tissue lymphoma translocation protein 1 homolog isoform X3 [Dendronephthya gigantea]